MDGKNTFLLRIEDNRFNTYYSIGSDGEKNRSVLIHSRIGRGCADNYKFFCAALIENDGWEIKEDYPVKF